MKKLIPVLIAVGILIIGGVALQSFIVKGGAFASGDQNRTVESFDRIAVSGSFNVFIKQGEQSIAIKADEGLLEKIKTEVKDNELSIYWDEKGNEKSDDRNVKVEIYITVPSVKELSLAGPGTIKGESNFSSDAFAVSVAGSGSISFMIDAKDVETDIAGSGDITLHGKTNSLSISIAGSGNFEGEKLAADDADVSIAGSGDVKVSVKNNLSADISGSGDVIYGGDPKVKKSIAGSGDVVKKSI